MNRPERLRTLILCASAVLVGCPERRGDLISRAPARQALRTNPLASDPKARQAGAKLFARNCAECHGMNREGNGKVPPLAYRRVYNAPPGAIYWAIRSGSVFVGMPPFAELPSQQRWQIVTFLKEDQPGSSTGSRSRSH
jgi:mono/diheme cytochrome c family protein